jgi:hypothetical protein
MAFTAPRQPSVGNRSHGFLAMARIFAPTMENGLRIQPADLVHLHCRGCAAVARGFNVAEKALAAQISLLRKVRI